MHKLGGSGQLTSGAVICGSWKNTCGSESSHPYTRPYHLKPCLQMAGLGKFGLFSCLGHPHFNFFGRVLCNSNWNFSYKIIFFWNGPKNSLFLPRNSGFGYIKSARSLTRPCPRWCVVSFVFIFIFIIVAQPSPTSCWTGLPSMYVTDHLWKYTFLTYTSNFPSIDSVHKSILRKFVYGKYTTDHIVKSVLILAVTSLRITHAKFTSLSV